MQGSRLQSRACLSCGCGWVAGREEQAVRAPQVRPEACLPCVSGAASGVVASPKWGAESLSDQGTDPEPLLQVHCPVGPPEDIAVLLPRAPRVSAAEAVMTSKRMQPERGRQEWASPALDGRRGFALDLQGGTACPVGFFWHTWLWGMLR